MKKFGEEAFLFQAARSRVHRGEPQSLHSFLTSPYLCFFSLRRTFAFYSFLGILSLLVKSEYFPQPGGDSYYEYLPSPDVKFSALQLYWIDNELPW
jgi:hypothetical protein